MSPTQRTLKYLRSLGYAAEVVERWIPGARVRKDLFGFIDIMAICKPEHGDGITLGVQATTTGHINERAKKIFDTPHFRAWVDCGHRAILIGWSKKGPRGKRKLWTPEVRELFRDRTGDCQAKIELHPLLERAPGSGSPEGGA